MTTYIKHKSQIILKNSEFETMNKIGTIRDQYEWQPKGNKDDWLIEEEKMSKVQPLVDFINHAGELKSTKVGKIKLFLIFCQLEFKFEFEI